MVLTPLLFCLYITLEKEKQKEMERDHAIHLGNRVVTYRGWCPTEASGRVSVSNAHMRNYIFLKEIKNGMLLFNLFSLVTFRNILGFATTYLLTKNRSLIKFFLKGYWCPWFCVNDHLSHLSA